MTSFSSFPQAILRSILFVGLLLVSPAFGATAARYQCSMHPWIKSDKPGKCTICGMDLVAITSSENTPADTTGITLPHSSITTIGVRTAVVASQPLTRTLRVAGRIDDDDTRHRILSARVPGRVEKLFINYIGAPVKAGEPLATLWSAEVLTAQRVFVERLKAGSIAFSASEQSAAREQLQQLGLSEDDISQLEKSREPSAFVTVRAPSAGVVVAKSVYEGQYVQSSDRLFEIADFSRMWFVFDAYAQDLPWLHVGQKVEITTRAVPGETISAPIEFIDPNMDEMRQTTRVRAILPNPHYSVGGESHRLPHRVLAEGRVIVETPAVLAAPRSAILDTGSGPVAYVATSEHRFEQRALQLGRRGDALVEVLKGLAAGEQVVTEGNLLIDAQAQLTREAQQAGSPETASSAPTPEAPVDSTVVASPEGILAQIAIDAADALGSDDFARYQSLFPRLVEISRDENLPKLELGDGLPSARRSFEPWSTAVADRLKPHRSVLGLKIFQCPMSPVLQKGRWVQRSAPLKNPFFGSSMPDCGEEIR
jgi:Cu(I)/Ag(I) efflux system membrane fusion protein